MSFMSIRNKITRSILILALLSVAGAPAKASEKPIQVTYIANEGVLLVTGNNKVLIDALFDKPNPNYRPPSGEMIERMLSGKAPFDNVDLVLVTHNHPDHFDPSFAAKFMENNPETFFIAAEDTVTALMDNIKDRDRMKDRVCSFKLEPGETAEKQVGGIAVKIFRTLHSGDLDSPHNLMFLIKMDGRTIFHEGDSPGKLTSFENKGLEEEKIDLALVHFWFPLNPDGASIIQDILKPDHTGLIHLPIRLESDAPGKIDAVKSYYKDIFLFVALGEKKTIR